MKTVTTQTPKFNEASPNIRKNLNNQSDNNINNCKTELKPNLNNLQKTEYKITDYTEKKYSLSSPVGEQNLTHLSTITINNFGQNKEAEQICKVIYNEDFNQNQQENLNNNVVTESQINIESSNIYEPKNIEQNENSNIIKEHSNHYSFNTIYSSLPTNNQNINSQSTEGNLIIFDSEENPVEDEEDPFPDRRWEDYVVNSKPSNVSNFYSCGTISFKESLIPFSQNKP